MKNITERHGYPAAIILSLIHHQRYGQNEDSEGKVGFFEITNSDLLKLSGLPELTDEFIGTLSEYLTNHDLDIVGCGNSWLLGNKDALANISYLPPGLLEFMSPGFVNNYFAEIADDTEVENSN